MKLLLSILAVCILILIIIFAFMWRRSRWENIDRKDACKAREDKENNGPGLDRK